MSASNSGDRMEWGTGRSSSSSRRKGKKTGSSGSSDKPRQPQRGLGVAQLEKIRIESEMEEYLHQYPLGHRPPIHRTGSLNLDGLRLAHSMPPSPSTSSFHANISASSSYPIHRPNLAAYGERGNIRYGDFQTNPVIRFPNYHGDIFDSEAHYSYSHHHQSNNITLPLFEPERRHDLNQPADSLNSEDDQQEVDLELKL